MISIAAIEQAAGITWSPDERTTLAGWELASNGGFTRRSNCATPTTSASTDPEARAAVQSWLAERGAPLVVRVTPLADEQVISRLEPAWGLERADETVVLTKRLASEPRGLGATVEPDNPTFASEILRLNQRPADSIAAWNRMVRRLGDNAAGVWEQGRAAALVTVSGSLAAIYSLAVEASHRRSGLATGVMATAESWAREHGADDAFLQVQGDNLAARAMYAHLGYKERYRYHYLQPLHLATFDPAMAQLSSIPFGGVGSGE